MLPSNTQHTVTVVVLAVVMAGIAGHVGAHATEEMPSVESTGVYESPCAATPPSDLSNPDSDVFGWENGYWFSESITIDQTNGVNDTEMNRLVNRTKARVEYVRCIEFTRPVPVTLISRQEFRNRTFQRNVSARLRTFDNVKFEALFLINESADSITIQNQNAASAILGFYDPRKDEIAVIAESKQQLRMDELTLAHELVHAYQDQQYNLTAPPFNVKLRDRVNAIDAVVEGDATYTEDLYTGICRQGRWQGTCVKQPATTGGGSLANLGVYFLKFYPYSDGPAFVRMVTDIGGWDAVDRLYQNPPRSTEQVIHPRTYRSDSPVNVTLNVTTTANWARVRPPDRPDYGTVGEAGLMMMLVYPLYHSNARTRIIAPTAWLNFNKSGNVTTVNSLDYNAEATAGWDGDRLHVYQNDQNETAYVWRIAWDSPQDARQFLMAYRRVLRYWGGERLGRHTWRIERDGFADAFAITVQGTQVTIVNAPTVEQLREIRPGRAPSANATAG